MSEELKQLFMDNFDCYTIVHSEHAVATEEPAITLEKFIELLNTRPTELQQVESKRFFVDIRGGCGAIRDSQHPYYDKSYNGLHNDTPDVVEYLMGYYSEEHKCWMLEDIQISLNGVEFHSMEFVREAIELKKEMDKMEGGFSV